MTTGDQVFYLLPRAPKNGRPRDLYLAVTVLKVSDKGWVSVRPNGSRGHRILKASSLVATAPQGAWIK